MRKTIANAMIMPLRIFLIVPRIFRIVVVNTKRIRSASVRGAAGGGYFTAGTDGLASPEREVGDTGGIITIWAPQVVQNRVSGSLVHRTTHRISDLRDVGTTSSRITGNNKFGKEIAGQNSAGTYRETHFQRVSHSCNPEQRGSPVEKREIFVVVGLVITIQNCIQYPCNRVSHTQYYRHTESKYHSNPKVHVKMCSGRIDYAMERRAPE